jgi:hypothetical protein
MEKIISYYIEIMNKASGGSVSLGIIFYKIYEIKFKTFLIIKLE